MVLLIFRNSVSALRIIIVSYEVYDLPFMHKETEFVSNPNWNSVEPASGNFVISGQMTLNTRINNVTSSFSMAFLAAYLNIYAF